MITVSEAAREGLHRILEAKGGGERLGLRLQVNGGVPGAYQADFRLVREGEERPDDLQFDQGKFMVFIDPDSAEKLRGVKIDYVPTFRGPSFKIEFPIPHWDDPLAARVQKLISDKINPGVASHGGYVTLTDVRKNRVYLIMGGGCQGCGMASATLRQGIETMIKESIPEIEEIIDQTDHEAGASPYYGPDLEGRGYGPSPLVEPRS